MDDPFLRSWRAFWRLWLVLWRAWWALFRFVGRASWGVLRSWWAGVTPGRSTRDATEAWPAPPPTPPTTARPSLPTSSPPSASPPPPRPSPPPSSPPRPSGPAPSTPPAAAALPVPGAQRDDLESDVAAEGEAPEPTAVWRRGRHTTPAGMREYRLYVPAGAAEGRPLLVMLHGCKQNPDDFAAGTQMNRLAGDERGWLVLYPAQSRKANRHGCWNWFRPADQHREGGEAEILAGMVERVITRYGADRRRVYVAGLSAGGAMAGVLVHTHPELFAAAGVHSGVPYGVAHGALSALHTMKRGHRQLVVWPFALRDPALHTGHGVPLIVFHGDADEVVHPRNGEQLIEQALGEALPASAADTVRVETGHPEGGHAWTRRLHTGGPDGAALEHWVVHGGGHAWSGGDASGSFTDPAGPSASAAMLRFFEAQEPARRGPPAEPTDSDPRGEDVVYTK